MSWIAWDDVVNVAPELANVTLVAQDAYLQVANAYLHVNSWDGEDGPKTHLGRIYIAAHLATLGLRRGIPGPVASSAAGGLSRSYAQVNIGSFSTLQLTAYGMAYIGLVKTTAARAGFALSRAPRNGGSLS